MGGIKAGLMAALILAALPVSAQNWYLSNPSGMVLDRIASKEAAFKLKWSLSTERVLPAVLPGLLKPLHEEAFVIERRVLYKEKKIMRRQWLFLDRRGLTRLNASSGEGTNSLSLIEIFSSEGFIVRTIHPGSEPYETVYSYSGGVLLKTETSRAGGLLWTDHYRYTRSSQLRGIERVFGDNTEYFKFPPPLDAFIGPQSPYEYSLILGALRDVFIEEAVKVLYSTDDRGRILTETRYDGEGRVLAEIFHTWSGDRLTQIDWTAGDNNGRVEFEYEDSERILERNYRNGALERTVTRDGDKETEELFVNGKPVLRAVWEDGRKIMEERL
jgi:hypothetical protein